MKMNPVSDILQPNSLISSNLQNGGSKNPQKKKISGFLRKSTTLDEFIHWTLEK